MVSWYGKRCCCWWTCKAGLSLLITLLWQEFNQSVFSQSRLEASMHTRCKTRQFWPLHSAAFNSNSFETWICINVGAIGCFFSYLSNRSQIGSPHAPLFFLIYMLPLSQITDKMIHILLPLSHGQHSDQPTSCQYPVDKCWMSQYFLHLSKSDILLFDDLTPDMCGRNKTRDISSNVSLPVIWTWWLTLTSFSLQVLAQSHFLLLRNVCKIYHFVS